LRGGHNAGAAFLRLFFAHQSALQGVPISFLDIRESAVDGGRIHVSQYHGDAARAEPLRDAGAHDAGTYNGRVRDLFRRGFR
jgi:hypothetical protein